MVFALGHTKGAEPDDGTTTGFLSGNSYSPRCRNNSNYSLFMRAGCRAMLPTSNLRVHVSMTFGNVDERGWLSYVAPATRVHGTGAAAGAEDRHITALHTR
jgi:hypothetical protein